MAEVTTSTPDASTVELVSLAIREGLKVAGALGLFAGTVTDSNITLAASALVGLAGVGWSIYRTAFKVPAEKHAIAEASATLGRAVSAPGATSATDILAKASP